MRALVPLLVLVLGGVVWGIASLQRIFADEHAQAHARIEAERDGLAEYARRTLEQRLEERLHGAEADIAAALRDPLAPTEHLLFREGGRDVLPRPVTYAAGEGTPAHAAYEGFRGGRFGEASPSRFGEASPSRPWSERLALARALRSALVRGDDRAVESTMRALLRHRAAWVIDATLDIPLQLAIVDALVSRGQPHPQLLAALLRDGIRDGDSVVVEGLQPWLVRRRDRFTAADFAALSDTVASLSTRASVASDDFRRRAGESAVATPRAWEGPDGGALVERGGWYVRTYAGARLLGVAVDVQTIAATVADEMRARGLLGEGDTVALPAFAATPSPLSSLQFVVDAPRFARARDEAERRWTAKTASLVGSFGLALVAVGLAVAWQQRERRFVGLRQEFVATVSHELRTPLASMRLIAETLERRSAGVPSMRDYPARMVKEIDGLAFLVDNILSFNRLARGKVVPRIEPVSLREVVDELREELHEEYGESAVLVAEGIDSVTLEADPQLLRLVLRNLVRNACTHNQRSPKRVEIRPGAPGDAWTLEIADNGVGIPAGERERIFDDFERGSAAGRVRGSGLGLAICRRAMAAHGGHVRVLRSSAEGTVLVLAFPAKMVRVG
jgi:signal transduction histidine kinase